MNRTRWTRLTSRTAMFACTVATATWTLGFAGAIQANATAQDHDHAATAQHDADHPAPAQHDGDHATPVQHEAGAHVHADAAKLINPVKSTPTSIAAGKALYDKQGVSCHGATGKGDGKSGALLTPKPSDLTDTSWKHGPSDGEIYTLIKDGSKNTGMKGYASKMTAQEMWSVVTYLRTLKTAN